MLVYNRVQLVWFKSTIRESHGEKWNQHIYFHPIHNGLVELWLPYDRFRWIMVDFYVASSYLRTSILSVFYVHLLRSFIWNLVIAILQSEKCIKSIKNVAVKHKKKFIKCLLHIKIYTIGRLRIWTWY